VTWEQQGENERRGRVANVKPSGAGKREKCSYVNMGGVFIQREDGRVSKNGLGGGGEGNGMRECGY